jgi:hypothetical protein
MNTKNTTNPIRPQKETPGKNTIQVIGREDQNQSVVDLARISILQNLVRLGVDAKRN